MDERKAVRVSMWMDFTMSDYLLTIRRLLDKWTMSFLSYCSSFCSWMTVERSN